MLKFEVLLLVLLDLLVSALIALRPTAFWRLTALALHGGASLYLIFANEGTTSQDYFFRVNTATKIFIAFHLVYLSDPLVEYRHERDTVPPVKRSFLYRMYWATCVSLNNREIGLNCQVSIFFRVKALVPTI